MIATANRPGDVTVTSFHELRLQPATLTALTRLGLLTPTPIQAQAVPTLLAGRDVIGQARTGSGKTLAFALPAIEVVDPTVRHVQVLILVPTRELAIQVGSVLDQVGLERGVSAVLIFGGRAAGPQISALRRGAPIVVGTPGRLLDLLNQGALDLGHVRLLVLDEADEMLDRGFAPDVERILGRTPPTRQTALFSATVPAWVEETARTYLREPTWVMVDPNPEDAAPIEHLAYVVKVGEKLNALRTLLDQRGEGSIIVFGRTKHGIKKLAKILLAEGYPVGALQGNLSQGARDRVMEDFRSGRVQILLATNVAARGLDITSIAQVINIELPESSELLTHRVGRTGRMGRPGQAITLLDPDAAAKWRQLEKGLGRRVQSLPWPGPSAISPAERTPSVASSQAPISERSRRASVVSADRDRGRDDSPPARRSNRPAVRRGERPPAPRAEPPSGGPDRSPVMRPAAESAVRSVDQAPAADSRNDRPGPGRVRHAIVCAGCGQPAEVPFRPDPARPVYCTACFTPRRPRPRR